MVIEFNSSGGDMKSLLGAIALLFLITSCTKNNNEDQPDPRVQVGGVVSDQFKENIDFRDEEPKFVAMIKLKQPALLSKIILNANSEKQIDESLKQKIIDEQNKMIDDLAKLSSKIKIIYRYKLVLNALAIEAPQSLSDEITKLEGAFFEGDERFKPPHPMGDEDEVSDELIRPSENNTMTFIGAEKVHSLLKIKDPSGNEIPVQGQGIRIGVIDSGIDYTHSMLGGSGNPLDYKSIDANQPSTFFPNQKVVGGKDFVGADYNTASPLYKNRIPVPDENPIDKGGHGSHVSGTIAGVGDGITSYSGAAPEASLYALKVFGDNDGSTSDTVVIAAMEYAADPNQDFKLDDQLHVVNLSLGSDYGKPHSLYSEAVDNLVAGGTLMAVAAGNAGPIENIVGSPSTAPAAISVAASIDNMDHNWKFPAVVFQTPSTNELLVEAVEGATTKKIKEAGAVTGKLVYIGNAVQNLSPELLQSLAGNVALIDRGEIPFDDKITKAVGAIGIVMVNNVDGNPIVMGGDKKFEIPGIMVTKAFGDILKNEITKGEVKIQFSTSKFIEKTELIDTLTSFSSQGPRGLDSLIKPEVTAPGENIISTKMGSGNKTTKMSGTSMATPHIAGVAALLRQYRPELSALQIKSLLMSSSKIIQDANKNIYPISRQGAGRVQAFEAATSTIAMNEAALSIGEVQVEKQKTLVKKIKIKNASDLSSQFIFSASVNPGMTIDIFPSQIKFDKNEEKEITLLIKLNGIQNESTELDSFINISSNGKLISHIPVLAIVNQLTRIHIKQLNVAATNIDEASGTAVQLTLQNDSLNDGKVYPFNFLGKDPRKPNSFNPYLSEACDLESAGYRIINRNDKKIFQIAVKLFNPVTGWEACDINVDIDGNDDGLSEQELKATMITTLPGFEEYEFDGLGTALFDAHKLRQIQQSYHLALAKNPSQPPSNSFLPALVETSLQNHFDHSTITILEAPVDSLVKTSSDTLKLRITVSFNGDNDAEEEDSLVDSMNNWKTISLNPHSMGYFEMPEYVQVNALSSTTVSFIKGENTKQDLILYTPRNKFILSLTGQDSQSEIALPSFDILNPSGLLK